MQTVPTPPMGRRGHVLVRVCAAGLNPVDAKCVMGDKLPHSWTAAHRWLRTHVVSRTIPGFDFAGVCVDAQGPHFAEGDAVFGTMPPLCGTLAEYISVPLDQICFMPNNLSFTEAAALPLVRYVSNRMDMDSLLSRALIPHDDDDVVLACLKIFFFVLKLNSRPFVSLSFQFHPISVTISLTAFQAMSPHVTSKSSVLVIGGSGGTGHVALQVARCLGASHITAICSTKNADFCRLFGATEIIDYTKANMLDDLLTSPAAPFDFVMDCVTSADPRDQYTNYPCLLQQQRSPLDSRLLSQDYVYRRLGGKSVDWIRAGLERLFGKFIPSWMVWPNGHERLFWIRFPRSSGELRQLQEWAETSKLRPHIAATYEFTPEAVQDAFDAIQSRRVQGKVVISVSCDAKKR